MSVYLRKNAKNYTMNFTYRGVRVNKSTGTGSRVRAEKVEANMKADIDLQLGPKNPSIVDQLPTPEEEDDRALLLLIGEEEDEVQDRTLTFEDAIKRAYFEKFEANTDGDITYRRLKIVSDWIEGDKLLVTMFTKKHIRFITKKLRDLRKAESTINRYLAHIRTVLYLAKDEWEIIDKIPKFKLTREKEGRLFFYTQEQERELIDWYIAKGRQREADLIAVLFDTGLRMGEARKMVYGKHIDLENRRITLTSDICKSGKPRTIPLTDRAFFVLTKIKLLTGRVQASPFGNLGYNMLQKHQVSARKELHLPKEACFHACRHTCATRLIENGVDIRTVQEWLGHSSITTTERYVKTTGQRLEQAASTLNVADRVAG